MIAGIPVGNISSIRLQEGKARVDIKMKPDVALHKDASLAKRSSSLLGEFVVVLGPGNDNQPVLKDGDQIVNIIEPTSTDAILKDLGEIAEQVKAVSKSLAGSVGTEKGEKDIQATLANLAEVTDNLNKAVSENRESIRRIIVNVEGITGRSGPEVSQILENVRVITSDVRTLIADDRSGVKGSMGSVHDTVDRGQQGERGPAGRHSTTSTRSPPASTAEKGTIGKLSKDETTINEVNNIVEGVGDLVGGIARTQTVIALRNDYFFQSNGIKSYVELRLQPREDKYYSIELINDPARTRQLRADRRRHDQPEPTAALSGDPGLPREMRCASRSSSPAGWGR